MFSIHCPCLDLDRGSHHRLGLSAPEFGTELVFWKGRRPLGKNWIAKHASTRHLGSSGHLGVRVGMVSRLSGLSHKFWFDYDLGIAVTGIPNQATANGWSRVIYWCIFFFLSGPDVPPHGPLTNPSCGGLVRRLDHSNAPWVG